MSSRGIRDEEQQRGILIVGEPIIASLPIQIPRHCRPKTSTGPFSEHPQYDLQQQALQAEDAVACETCERRGSGRGPCGEAAAFEQHLAEG